VWNKNALKFETASYLKASDFKASDFKGLKVREKEGGTIVRKSSYP
jgi:hypothetical protein